MELEMTAITDMGDSLWRLRFISVPFVHPPTSGHVESEFKVFVTGTKADSLQDLEAKAREILRLYMNR